LEFLWSLEPGIWSFRASARLYASLGDPLHGEAGDLPRVLQIQFLFDVGAMRIFGSSFVLIFKITASMPETLLEAKLIDNGRSLR
jgi:hypothetical protein